MHGGSVFLRTTHHARHICSSSIVNSSCMETSIKVSMCGTSPKVNQFITRELKIITHWLLVGTENHHAWYDHRNIMHGRSEATRHHAKEPISDLAWHASAVQQSSYMAHLRHHTWYTRTLLRCATFPLCSDTQLPHHHNVGIAHTSYIHCHNTLHHVWSSTSCRTQL